MNGQSNRMNVTGKQEKIVQQINAETNEIMKEWKSLTACSKECNVSSSGMSHDILYNMSNDKKRIRGNIYFIYKDYVKS